MIENACKNCNAPLDMAEAKNGVIVCSFCGSVFTLPKADASDKVKKHLDAGETALDQCRFDDALASFTKAIEADKTEPEAYWGRALARNKVQYLRDTVNNRLQPICHKVTDEAFTTDPDCRKALNLATPEQRAAYGKKAEEIDYIRREFYALEKSGLTYDSFICVKVTDENGNPTRDSLDATRIYMELQRAGYKPFFSEYEMGGRTGADYEALILYALHKAPCMLIVCSDAKYLETKWVRNEFTRFYAMLADEEKERDSVTIAYKGKVIERLPGVRGKIQGVDLTNLAAIDRIRAFIDSHDAAKRAAAEAVQAEATRRAEAEKAEAARRAADEAAAKAQALEERLKKLEQRETERNKPSPAAPGTPKAQTPKTAPKTAPVPAPQAAAGPHRARPAPAVRVYPAEFEMEGTTLTGYTGSAETVAIPEGVTEIKYGVFADNRRLAKVTIPWTVTKIGNSAFSGCSSLQAVTIPPSVREIGDFAFDKCRSLTNVTIADGVQFIGQYAFSSCPNLRSVTIPASVKTVESEAFYDCGGLSVRCVARSKPAAWASRWNGDCAVTWGAAAPQPPAKPAPAPVRYKAPLGFMIEGTVLERYIGADANVAVPSWITEIKEYAFASTENLLSVTIPPSVRKVGRDAFAGCPALKAVYIDDLAAWCRISFQNTKANPTHAAGALIVGDRPLTELTVPAGAEVVEYAAFYNVRSLTKVTISRQVKNIGKYAFTGCDNLASILVDSGNLTFRAEGNCLIEKRSDTVIAGCNASVLPAHPAGTNSLAPRPIKAIAPWAFYRCGRLQTAGIPEGVTEIGDHAFSDCAALASVTLPLSLKSIGKYAFSGCRALKSLYLPKTVETVGEHAFDGCAALALACGPRSRPDGWDAGSLSGNARWGVAHPDKKIAAAQSGLNIKDGVLDLYTGDGGDVEIPDGVTKIAGRTPDRFSYNDPKGAFHNSKTLTGVTIPAGVTEIGDYAFCNCRALGKAEIPDSVAVIGQYAFNNCETLAGVKLPGYLTAIGAHAFDGCGKITALTVPAGVTAIGAGAFYCCNALESVSFRAGVAVVEESLFEHCVSLKRITLPEGVTEIKQRAFKDCESLTEIVIPESVTAIGERAFEGCASLKKIVLPAGCKTIDKCAFADCAALISAAIPDAVGEIGAAAFDGCTALASVALGKGVRKIGECAFKGCAALKTVTLPDAVDEIGDEAFADCAALASVAFGKSVRKIGESAFKGTGLVSLTVPDTVTEIGDEAFADCAALKQLFLTEKVNAGWDETIGCTGHAVFARCTALTEVSLPMRQVPESLFIDCTALKTVLFEHGVEETWYSVFAGCTALENVVLSDTVKKIADGTFLGCTALREIDIPDSVTEIGRIEPDGAFKNCTALERVRMPANLDTLGRCTFEGCTALKEVTLPDAVRWIHWNAFNGCTALKRVSIPGTVVEINPGAFDSCPNLTVEIRRKKPLLFPGKWYKGMKKCRLEWKG